MEISADSARFHVPEELKPCLKKFATMCTLPTAFIERFDALTECFKASGPYGTSEQAHAPSALCSLNLKIFFLPYLTLTLWAPLGGAGPTWKQFQSAQVPSQLAPRSVEMGTGPNSEQREREMFYLTTHSTHVIYGNMASNIWLRTILILRKETRCRHIGYSYRLTARILLYAPSHRQDNTYHGLCYTSRGALAGTRNSSMGPTHEGSIL